MPQTYIEPFLGYAADIREKQNLHMVNSGVQLSFSKKSDFEFVLGICHSLGIKRKGSDSSFTLNPTLPVYSNAPKKIHAEFSGIFSGFRAKMIKIRASQYINVNFLAGIRFQRVVVDYKLNSPDYIVLNPETNAMRFGLYVGSGLEYVYHLKKNRIIFQTNIVSPSIRRRNENANSFNLPVPLNFNIMYSVPLRKK